MDLAEALEDSTVNFKGFTAFSDSAPTATQEEASGKNVPSVNFGETPSKDKGPPSPKKRKFVSALSLRQVATNVISGFSAYAEEQRLKEVRQAIKLAVGDAVRLLAEMQTEKDYHEVEQHVEQSLNAIVVKEVRSFTEMESRLRRAENRMDFMQKQLELRGLLAKYQREELLKEISVASEQRRHWHSKHNELLEQYRDEKQKRLVSQASQAITSAASMRSASIRSGSIVRSDTTTPDFGALQNQLLGGDLFTSFVPEPVAPSIDVGGLGSRLDAEWVALEQEERAAATEEAMQLEAEQRIKGLQVRLKQEQEAASKKLTKKMDDLLQMETQKLENKVRQLELQLKRKEFEMELATQTERERFKVLTTSTENTHRASNHSLILGLSKRTEVARMELADMEAQAMDTITQLQQERNKARQLIVTTSRENDHLRKEADRLRGSKLKDDKAGATAASKALEKTAKQLQATLLSRETEIDKLKEAQRTEHAASQEKIKALQAALSSAESAAAEAAKSKAPEKGLKPLASTAATISPSKEKQASANLEKQKAQHEAQVAKLLERIEELETEAEQASATVESSTNLLKAATFRVNQLEVELTDEKKLSFASASGEASATGGGEEGALSATLKSTDGPAGGKQRSPLDLALAVPSIEEESRRGSSAGGSQPGGPEEPEALGTESSEEKGGDGRAAVSLEASTRLNDMLRKQLRETQQELHESRRRAAALQEMLTKREELDAQRSAVAARIGGERTTRSVAVQTEGTAVSGHQTWQHQQHQHQSLQQRAQGAKVAPSPKKTKTVPAAATAKRPAGAAPPSSSALPKVPSDKKEVPIAPSSPSSPATGTPPSVVPATAPVAPEGLKGTDIASSTTVSSKGEDNAGATSTAQRGSPVTPSAVLAAQTPSAKTTTTSTTTAVLQGTMPKVSVEVSSPTESQRVTTTVASSSAAMGTPTALAEAQAEQIAPEPWSETPASSEPLQPTSARATPAAADTTGRVEKGPTTLSQVPRPPTAAMATQQRPQESQVAPPPASVSLAITPDTGTGSAQQASPTSLPTGAAFRDRRRPQSATVHRTATRATGTSCDEDRKVVSPSRVPSPRVALRSDEMMKRAEEKRLVLLSQQRVMAERVAVTDPTYQHIEGPYLNFMGESLLKQQEGKGEGLLNPMVSSDMADLVAKAQVELKTIAEQSMQQAVEETTVSETSAIKHFKSLMSSDVKFYQRNIGTQTEAVPIVEMKHGHQFPMQCFHPVLQQLHAQLQQQAGGATVPLSPTASLPNQDKFAVVLVCQPFVRHLNTIRCSLLQSPYIFREEAIPSIGKPLAMNALPIPETDTTRQRIIEALHATAHDALKRLRAAQSLGPSVDRKVSPLREPNPNTDGMHVATIAAPPEVVVPAAYVPTAATTLARRTRQRPQSATVRHVSPDRGSTGIPPALHRELVFNIQPNTGSSATAQGDAPSTPRHPGLPAGAKRWGRPQSAATNRRRQQQQPTALAGGSRNGVPPSGGGGQTAPEYLVTGHPLGKSVKVSVQEIAPFETQSS